MANRHNEMILAFSRHAEMHYRAPDGNPTGETDNFKDALRLLRKLYGSTPARLFGALKLRAVQEEMIRSGLLVAPHAVLDLGLQVVTYEAKACFLRRLNVNDSFAPCRVRVIHNERLASLDARLFGDQPLSPLILFEDDR